MKEKTNKKQIKKGMIFALAMIIAMSVVVPINVSAVAKKSLTVAMKGIKISKNKATLEKKKATWLTVKYNGKNVTAKASYKSSKPKVVSVSKKGKIKAKKKGKCVITVKYKKMSKKLKLTVKSAKNASFPVGTYSYVAEAGGYRGAFTIDSAGIATYIEWSSGTGKGCEIKYQMTVDNTVTVPNGVTAYLLKFIKGSEIQLTENGIKVTGNMKRGDNRSLYYDAKRKTLKDTGGFIWEPVK